MNLKWLKPGGKALWLVLALLAALLLFSLSQGGGESGATAEERRIAQVLSAIDGAGKVEVALFYEPVPAGAFGESGAGMPVGAVVVAQGAGDLGVRLSLIRAMRTLTSLPEQAVDVFVMEGSR